MKRKIISLADAQTVLSPYYDKIQECIGGGFNDLQTVLNCTSSNVGYSPFDGLTKACMVHCLIKARIEQEFTDTNNIEVGTWKRIFALKIGEDLFVRFKKLNNDYSASFVPTKQAKGYAKQLLLDGFPDEPTFIFAGYIPDKTWTKTKGIYIACWNGGTIEWVEEIQGKVSIEQVTLPFEELIKTERRIKIKPAENQDDISKTGTDG